MRDLFAVAGLLVWSIFNMFNRLLPPVWYDKHKAHAHLPITCVGVEQAINWEGEKFRARKFVQLSQFQFAPNY